MNPVDQGYDTERFQSAVDEYLHCPICQNVLKQPVQCRQNEHYFCLHCITKHLEANFQTCPICIEGLTVETLRQPSRIVANMLSVLKIRCDNASRGCEEVVELGALKTHVDNCAFTPTTCPLDGCSMVLNKGNIEHHENQVCEFRRLKCEDCGQEILDKDYNVHACVLRRENNELKDQVKELTRKSEERFSAQEELMKEMRNMMEEMKVLIKPVTSGLIPRRDFLIAGGYDGTSGALSSVEKYVCSVGAWVPLPPMTQVRHQPSSFVHENQVYVCGGSAGSSPYTSDTIERMHTQDQEQWLEFEGKLSSKCNGQTSTLYQDCLIITGGYTSPGNEVSDAVHEVLINRPFTSNLVCRMPEARRGHGAVLFNNKILIVGGTSTRTQDAKYNVASVVSYDINVRKCEVIGNLPYAVSFMALACHGNNLIVMGGWDVNRKALKKVVMFNVETRTCETLPSMNIERASCTAIITDNVIVVMGGTNEKGECLNFVESFNIDRRVWKELPSMAKARAGATAVVL